MTEQLTPETLNQQIRCVSHEIRNHLSICDMYSQIIRKNLEKSQIENASIEKLFQRFQFQYPYIEDITLHSKASVTEIKKQSQGMEQEEEQDAFQAFGEEVELPEIIPDFEKEDIDEPQYLTGAMRGTAYHRIFELLDMELEEYNQETVKKMIDGFVDAGLIDRMGAASVMRKDIIDFTKSDLFRRMKKAYANNQLYREQHFLMGVPACEINSNTTSKETMIIQGIIDLCFVENDKYVIVDYKTDKVLMVAYMNEEAYNMTIATGKMTYYSRSRQELWIKGLTSGHYQYVSGMKLDCDNDTILAIVRQAGAACHTGAHSCFFKELTGR